MKKLGKNLLRLLAILAIAYLLLLIPDGKGNPPRKAAGQPFAWKRDSLWQGLEKEFAAARQKDTLWLDSSISIIKKKAEADFAALPPGLPVPADIRLNTVLNDFFALAPLLAARGKDDPWLIDYYNRVRNRVKDYSANWDMSTPAARQSVYQMLYGMRAATEEVWLQSAGQSFQPEMPVRGEPSATPEATLFGITVHSGDLLVSRGGAEVSALISRGNDYPGNFSHVALLYVDSATHEPWLVEAHIEKGVAIADPQAYTNDKKLRVMVMRPRAALLKDPMLPHKAAKLAFEESKKRHIPYDFKMNFADSSAMFCSEVGSWAYKRNGLAFWQAESTLSSQGVVNWLHAFGVENFVTQMPSDLEYDPQLSIVAEWRDPETLFKDHLDNAVMDVLLEQADAGKEIGYSRWMLPLARVIKGYSMLLNAFGKTAKIPEGMSATQALKNNHFVEMHTSLKKKTQYLADQFIKNNQYRPPYWRLVQMAREAVE